MVELVNISKTFKSKGISTNALADVSIKISEGEIYGVIGSSGAGKSTLIRCVNLLERPDNGAIVINGQNIMTLPQQQLTVKRREIGMIFQHFNLFSSRTVFENIAFPLELTGKPKIWIKERVNELLQLVGLESKANDYPANLSGGQKQRVAIARALANNPSILLCDEATSALDPHTTKSILQLLRSINKKLNLTILLITHEMEVIKTICDRVAVLDHGRLIEQGTVEQIFTTPKEEVTKQFIASSFNAELPQAIQHKLKETGNPVVKLFITGNEQQSLLISDLQRLYHTDAKLISAQIEYIGQSNFGLMFLELGGESQAIQESLTYLKTNYSSFEIIGYV
ncbi:MULTISPECIES: methionine ABC transporter ATP-binding protein [unclassified Sphingobacterium]|uniref:methionine ABC transporter ATP-binding protein n=1 Tax=unclassified Sphingobacterium TaxID=2609468 RepID=UPI0025F4981E|nr:MULTISPECIES: methionine ABC transporter ATP-binding protein [unclassified Sphingobacterium]